MKRLAELALLVAVCAFWQRPETAKPLRIEWQITNSLGTEARFVLRVNDQGSGRLQYHSDSYRWPGTEVVPERNLSKEISPQEVQALWRDLLASGLHSGSLKQGSLIGMDHSAYRLRVETDQWSENVGSVMAHNAAMFSLIERVQDWKSRQFPPESQEE